MIPVFCIGKAYRLSFGGGESWIGVSMGDLISLGDNGKPRRLLRFNAGIRQENGSLRSIEADIQTDFLVAVEELPRVKLSPDELGWVWVEDRSEP